FLDLRAEENARVVDEHVQLAVRAHGRRHRRAPVRLARHVQMYVGDFAARGADLGLDLLALVVENVAQHHRGALADEHPAFDSALSLRAAADQRYLAVQSSHRILPNARRREPNVIAGWSAASRCTPRCRSPACTRADSRPLPPT